MSEDHSESKIGGIVILRIDARLCAGPKDLTCGVGESSFPIGIESGRVASSQSVNVGGEL
jgi:hypothetical protein